MLAVRGVSLEEVADQEKKGLILGGGACAVGGTVYQAVQVVLVTRGAGGRSLLAEALGLVGRRMRRGRDSQFTACFWGDPGLFQHSPVSREVSTRRNHGALPGGGHYSQPPRRLI